MEHQKLDTKASNTLMLPRECGDEKAVIITASNSNGGKHLIREDTILSNLQGCAGCGKVQFSCGVKDQWSVLCWGKQTDRKYYTVLTLLSATFVLSLIGTVFFCFTNTVNDVILSNMIIRNNTLAYKIWKRPDVQPLMKVHIFNYTNWDRFREGLDERLNVEDVGPYVYSQEVERVNIKFDGDTVTFQEKNTFRYMPELSNGASFDQVVVPNLPLLGVISKAIDINFNSFLLNNALKWANHPEPFLKLPVQSFLWGYDDSIISIAKPILSLQGQMNFEKFGLLVTKNGTNSDRLTINTGVVDKDRMNMIERYNGAKQLNFWGSQDCNSIESSDGSIFPPAKLDRETLLQVFYPNLCRRLPFEYDKDIEISDGIKLLRYRMPQNVFDDPGHNPANQCYCEIDTATCPPRGVINVTACTMGAPALVSLPHFHLGDPHLREDVTGLHPDPTLHENYLDVHPTLGIALSGKSSLQINIQVRKNPGYTALNYLNQGLILPVAWLDIGVTELPENLKSLVYHGTFSTAAAQLGLAIVAVVALIVSGACLCVLLLKKRRKPCATLKKIPVETELKPES